MAQHEIGLSRLALGCSRIGSFSNPQSPGEGRRLIEAALDLGVCTIDTSNIYGQGDSERQIGRAIAGRRDMAFIVTKAGRDFSAKMRLLAPFKPVLRPALAALGRGAQDPADNAVTSRREEELRMDWDPRQIVRSLEGSLRRLRTDRVDGFLLHSPPAPIAGDERIAATLAGLKAEGKVRHFGVSCDDRECLTAALEMPGLTLLQLPWNLIVSLSQAESRAIGQKRIHVLAREVIRLQPKMLPRSAVLSAAHHPAVSCTIVGTSSRDHLRDLATCLSQLPQPELAAT